jgi:hypothetical protein
MSAVAGSKIRNASLQRPQVLKQFEPMAGQVNIGYADHRLGNAGDPSHDGTIIKNRFCDWHAQNVAKEACI